ncbi:MAG TPA: lipase maturation factor family protein [Gemmatimonadales bacterium]|nr:lipase maturation factor family protein [Gemmatimonadales bacterium]
MEWFSAPDYQLTRFALERGIGLIYLIAFVVALNQFPALLGEHGLMPAPRFLRRVSFREFPSLFHLRYSDGLLRLVAWTGIVLSAVLVAGLPQRGPLWVPTIVWLGLWVLYLSIVNIGQVFYSFGWESILLEAGFFAIFLGNAQTAPAFPVLLLFRWLAFRVELGAGLIKLRGDPCWRDLTCMDYHHETQPIPNPLSRYVHLLPKVFHRAEVVGNYVAQLGAPFLLFLPQPIAGIGALLMIATQAYLVLSGNYAWLNVLTMVIAAAAVPDAFFRVVLPWSAPATLLAPPAWYVVLVLLVTAVVAVLSYWPVANLFARRQLMNYAFNRLHLVGTYGAFGSITRERYEIVMEGTSAATVSPQAEWREYQLKAKPGDPWRRPRQVAPYHLRLDWLMWFAALSPSYAEPWFRELVGRLLAGDRQVLRLLGRNPFPDAPPVWLRARYYHYRFATRAEHRATGAWWVRELAGDFLTPVTLAKRAT